MTQSLTSAHSNSLTQNMFSQEADLHDRQRKSEALLTSVLSLWFWNLTHSWQFKCLGMWCGVVGWTVRIIPEDHGAFIFKGKQSSIIFQIITNQSPNSASSHHRTLESSATPLWEPQMSHDMLLPEVSLLVASFSLWSICWSYPPCHEYVGSGDS